MKSYNYSSFEITLNQNLVQGLLVFVVPSIIKLNFSTKGTYHKPKIKSRTSRNLYTGPNVRRKINLVLICGAQFALMKYGIDKSRNERG